jgi:hypothetical protein
MRLDHKVTKDFFQPSKTLPTIRIAAKKRLGLKRSEMLPVLPHTFLSPSQPHSKMWAR